MKKLIIVILYSVTLPSFLFSQNKWIEVFQSIGNPQAIKCIDETNCYILNYGSPTRLYQSQDGGDTWILLNEIKELRVEYMSIADSNNIYIAFNNGNIYHSNDAGKSFTNFRLDSVNSFPYIAMSNELIGVITDAYIIPNIFYILITKDGWKTFEKLALDIENIRYSFHYPHFINDSILYAIVRVYDERVEPQNKEPPIDKPRITGHVNHSLMKLNINTLEYELIYIDHLYGFLDFFVLDEENLFCCGISNTISGGSCRDAIYKSTDAGKTWNRVLDLYYHNKLDTNSPNPFGLQSIAFKDSLTGIAVGQFGKIVYTYDGGESWTYESELPYKLGGVRTPPVMKIRYAGEKAIITEFSGSFHRLQEDNLAPGEEHKYSISGRVWEGDKGQAGVCIALGHRVTMTDKEGYYRFGMLSKGDYNVKVINKYGPLAKGSGPYEPFDYSPLEYKIELTSDTSGFDFNAEDLRTFYKVEGYIVDDKGQGVPDIFLRTGSSTTTTDESGRFEFPKIESRLTFDVIPYSDVLAFSPSSHRINLITGDTTDLLFTATPATSIWESANSSSLILHPNPAIEYIEIIPPLPKGDSELASRGIYDVKIYNMLGECVITTPSLRATPSEKGNLRIDVSHLPTGVYYISMGNKFDKFVVVR